MQNHEYSVIGHSRASIGRWLGVASGLASSLIATLIAATAAFAKAKGYIETKEFLILPGTAALFYALGHLAFDKWGWRSTLVHKVIGIPDLRGRWNCHGETIDPITGNVKFAWDAAITITQSWEKIIIYAQTKSSRSHSVAASLLKKDGLGYVLMYSYRNEPKPGEPELNPHFGYSEWHIETDAKSAEAIYFNSGGRYTGGTMKLSKVENA